MRFFNESRWVLGILTLLAAAGLAGIAGASDGGDARGGDVFAPTVWRSIDPVTEDGTSPEVAVAVDPETARPVRKQVTSRPVWQFLSDLSPAERAVATIEIEACDTLGSTSVFRTSRAAELWNGGRPDDAIALLQAVESEGVGLGVAVTWDPASAPKMHSVQVGGHTGVQDQDLVVDMASGNQFAIVEHTEGGGESCSLYVSFDGGASWLRTGEVYLPNGFVHVSAVVAGPYVYIGYIAAAAADEGRIRRAVATNGIMDGAYGYQTVYTDIIEDFVEVELASSVDGGGSVELYYFSNHADGLMNLHQTDEDGGTGAEPWDFVNTGVWDAAWGLDSSWALSFVNLYVSYVGEDGTIHIWRRGIDGNDVSTFSYQPVGDAPSISALGNEAFVVWRSSSGDITYLVSYNGASTWFVGSVATGNGHYQPQVTLRHHTGVIVTYSKDESPDDVMYMTRRSYEYGPWSETVRCTDNDVVLGVPSSLARLADGGYGVLSALSTSNRYTRYDESPLLFIGDFELNSFIGWSDHTP